MAPVVFTSSYRKYLQNKNNFKSTRFFSATVEDFDGETYDYEVSGSNFEEATHEVEKLAAYDGICINFIQIFAL